MPVEFADPLIPQNFGWSIHHPDRIPFAQSQPTLYQSAPHLYEEAPPENVYLYKAWKDVLKTYPDYPAQAIGDCTSFGTGHTLDLLQCVQISLGHQNATFKELCTEAIYGIGREIAGMLGSGDGCFGGAVAKAVTQFGTISREDVGPYSGQRAKTWGGRGGVPADVKAKLGTHKAGAFALVKTPDDVHAAIANANPCIVCSNQGFTMVRDSTGKCSPKGHWGHCMGISGVRTQGGKRQFLIDQSWGSDTPSGPLADDQPPFSFWIDEPVMASMLREEDSWALSAYAGFPGNKLPDHWTVEGWAL